MSASAALHVEQLHVTFGADGPAPVHAVRGVDLAVEPGQIVALVGASGSGKSATAMSVLGLTAGRGVAVRGRARLGDLDLLAVPRAVLDGIRGRQVAAIFQDPSLTLNPVQRIGAQIVEQIRAHEPVGTGAARRRAIDLLGEVGMPDPALRVDAFPHELSGGLRQRAMIAMALSCGPQLLIADEPTTALDVTVQAQILELLLRLRDDRGMGMLLVTHDFGVVARIADEVCVMAQGEIVERGPAQQLLASPSMPETRELLRLVPRLDGPRLAGLPARPAHVAGDRSAALELRAVTRSFGRGKRRLHAVDGVSLSLAPGETLGLVGESGSGKSTLARIAMRLIEPDAGQVLLAGVNLTALRGKALRSRRRQLQMVFQDPSGSLNPRRRAGQVLADALAAGGRASGVEQVAAELGRVGLSADYAERFPHQLSGGQRQRIGVARALAARPMVLIADEPVSALDVAVQAQLLILLVELQAEFGLAQLFVSHDLAVVRQLADNVAVMQRGALVEQGPASTVLHEPQQPYTRALLAAARAVDPNIR